MSVVAARITDTGYEIASDSISVRWYTQRKDDAYKHSKLFEVNDLVIGAVGKAEESAMLRVYATTRKPAAATDAAMLEYLSEFVEWKKKRVDSAKLENAYLFGVEGKLFTANGWFITEVGGFEAIGAGMDFALAALHMGHSVEDACKTACELSVYCEEPVQVIRKTTRQAV